MKIQLDELDHYVQEVKAGKIRYHQSHLSPEITKDFIPGLKGAEALWCYLNKAEPATCSKEGCSNRTAFHNLKVGYRPYCSNQCSKSCPVNQAKQRQRSLEKYGVEHVFQRAEVKDSIARTSKERYGVERASKDPAVIEKMLKTSKERYGDYSTVVAKRASTNNERYGTEWPSQLREFKLKNSETIRQKHREGLWDPQTEEAKQKRRETMLERYGVECGFEVSDSLGSSKPNDKFARKLEEAGIPFSREVKIGSYRADFVIGDMVVEINPTGTHNSDFCPYGKSPKTKTYHLDKTKAYEERGYRCIHVFDWDDFDKIISLLRPKTLKYARKAELREVPKVEAAEFLNRWHLQGEVRGEIIRLGLYFGGELCQIMTFGKPRYNKKADWELLRLCSHGEVRVIGGARRLFEGFKKIVKGSPGFQDPTYREDLGALGDLESPDLSRTVKPAKLVSYCDRSKFDGKVYRDLGFTLLKENPPSLHWSKMYRGVKPQHFTDNMIRRYGFDHLFGTSFGKGVSNNQLMEEAGFVRVWDCGQSTFMAEF